MSDPALQVELQHQHDEITRLRNEYAALWAERDALKTWLFGCKKERDAIKSQMETVAKGSFDATAVMAEENRLLREELVDYRTCNQSANGHIGELSNQLGQARADVAKLRAALQKLLPWCDKVPESVFDHAKDVLAGTQDPPIFVPTPKP